MRDIKLIIFDIDGTLIDRSKETVENSAIEAINKAKHLGYHILVATGRSFFFIQEDVRKRIISEFYVSANGACLNDSQGLVIKSYPFSHETLNKLIDHTKKHDYTMGIKYEDYLGVFGDYDYFYKYYNSFLKTERSLLINENQKHHNSSLPLGVYLFASNDKIKDLNKEFLDLNFIETDSNAIQATKKNVNKTNAISDVLSNLDLTWDNVMAFGDGHNDLEMIQKAKIGVAMGNADEYVKSKADFITDTVLNDGISKALYDLKIIKQWK